MSRRNWNSEKILFSSWIILKCRISIVSFNRVIWYSFHVHIYVHFSNIISTQSRATCAANIPAIITLVSSPRCWTDSKWMFVSYSEFKKWFLCHCVIENLLNKIFSNKKTASFISLVYYLISDMMMNLTLNFFIAPICWKNKWKTQLINK